MTHKITASLTVLTLLAGAAIIATPASAQNGRKSGVFSQALKISLDRATRAPRSR